MVSWSKRLASGLGMALVDRPAQQVDAVAPMRVGLPAFAPVPHDNSFGQHSMTVRTLASSAQGNVRRWLAHAGVAVALLSAGGVAWAAPNADFTVGVNNKDGSPTSVAPGETTTVLITLTNDSATPLTGVSFSNLTPNPATGNTFVSNGNPVIVGAGCSGGTVTASAPPDGAVINLSGLTVPAKVGSTPGICYIEIPVKAVSGTGASSSVSYTLGDNSVSTSSGDTNEKGGGQAFNINAVSPPTWEKGFSSDTAVLGGDNVTLTLKVTNPDDGVALTGVAFEDVFPTVGSGAVIEPVSVVSVLPASCGTTSNVTTTTGAAAKVAVSGLSVAKGGSCEVKVTVKASHTNGKYELGGQLNKINPASFSSNQGLKPAAEKTANITVRSPLQVAKSASPARVASGDTGTFVITLSNSGSTALPITQFNETNISDIQSGQRLTPTGIVTTCPQTSGQTRTTATTATGFTSSGYSVPANASCAITVSFTGTTSNNQPLTFTNNIPEGDVKTSVPGIVSEQKSATVTLIDELYVDKERLSPAVAAPGNPIKYTVKVSNFGTTARSDVHVTDALNNGSTFLTGMFNGVDYTPEYSCSGTSTSNVLGSTSLDFLIPTLPATSGNIPGQCSITFWVLSDPNNPNLNATDNQIAECGVWYGASQSAAEVAKTCNGSASNSVRTTHQAPLQADKTFNGTNYQYPKGYNAANNSNYANDAETGTRNSKPEGTVVTMRIRVRNYNDQEVTSVTVSDTFPAGLTVASPANASTNCGGIVIAPAGSTSLALNNARLPARNGATNAPGMCTVQVDVVGPAKAETPFNYPNTARATASLALPAGGSQNLTADSNTAVLTYTGALKAAKSFEPAEMTPDGKSQVRIRLTNDDAAAALTGVAVIDPLTSAKLKLADPTNLRTTCGGNPVLAGTAGATSVSLTGVTLPPSGSCDLLFDVVNDGSDSGNWVNTIPAGNVTADGGIRNAEPVTATLARSGAQTPAVTKSINPTSVAPGQPARLTIDVTNGTQALSGVGLTDYFTLGGTEAGSPSGMQVATPANASTTCPAGVLTATPGSNKVALTGATLAAAASCTITVDVISTNPGTVVNSIPLNTLVSDQGQTNSTTFGEASLQTSKSVTLDKGFNPAVISVGQRSRLRISFLNSTVVVAPNFAVTDNLPANMYVPVGPNIVQTCGPNTVVDVSDNTKVKISKGTLPGAVGGTTASCYVELDVTASVEGEYVNNIPTKSLTVDGKEIEHPPVTDTQHVLKPLVLHKAIDSKTLDSSNTAGFSSGTALAKAGEAKTLTLHLHNTNTTGVLTEIRVQDNLPSGLVVAQTPNASTTCGGVVTAPASAAFVRLTGATLAAGASCRVTVDVLSNIPGSHVNSIPSGAVSTKEGVTNGEPTSAEVIISSPPTVGKQFSPAVIPANGTSKLTIVLNNPNATAITLSQALVDNLPQAPGSMKVAATPNVNKTCPGTVTAIAGATTVTYASGATIPAGGCTIEVDVIADLAGDYNNNIPAGELQTDAGSNSDPANAPLKVSTQGFISGKVFADNKVTPDGIFASGDKPLPGALIELYVGSTCSGTAIAQATTDAQGNYLFAGLPADTYSVCQSAQPAGTNNGITTAGTIQAVNGSSGTPGNASNPTANTSQITSIVLGDTQTGEVSGSVNNNFAEIIPSSISGKVFLDHNNDGLVNGSDSGIPGQLIELWKDSVKVAEKITDADGNYRFDGLEPGDYVIKQPNQPDGTSNGKAIGGVVPNGGTPGTGSNPTTTSSEIGTVKLPPNTQSTGNNFAELPNNRSISGSVFLDHDNSGVPGGNNKGIEDQVIELWKDGSKVAEVRTKPDGSYRFDNLPEGVYTVKQPNQPVGTTNGNPQSPDGTGSNPTATSSEIATIDLTGNKLVSVDNNFPELPGAAPDLKIVKTSVTDMVAAGSNVPGIFTLAPSNIGSVDTSGAITITDNLPAGMTLAEPAVGAGWICPAGAGASVLTCTTNDIIAAGGNGAVITVKVLVAASADGKVLINTARIAGGGEPDGFVGPENQSSAQVSASQPARISGTVWRDNNHTRTFTGNEPRVAGVLVELMRNGVVVATAVTGADGTYSFGGLPAGTGYDLRFKDSSGAVFIGSVTNESNLTTNPGQRDSSDAVDGVNNGNPAGATIDKGALKGMTLLPGDHIIEQSLPLDPSGVVYDAVTRQPVAGAVVTLRGPGGQDVSNFILNGSSSQTTGLDGMYQFWLSAGAPAGEYTLEVTQYPSGYLPNPSTLIPACQGAPNVGAAPVPALVQQSDFAPAANVASHDPAACQGIVAGGVPTTQYYFRFNLTPGTSANVVNNHIPLDPILGGAIVMTKVTPKVNVTRGELVPYTLTARNTLTATLSNIAIEDQIPPGFKYIKNSAQIDGVPVEPEVQGRLLRWPNQTINAGQVRVIKLLLVVGSGVGFNEYVNQTWAANQLANARVSNVATATVRVVADPTFDCSDLIGKVFDDKNRNGYQDEGEPGIPGVRLATPKGWLVTTDEYGRYHIACADVPSEMRGSNFIIKVDERTLPSGYRVITENPRVVRLTQGRLVKANFGASIHRVVRLDLNGDAFGKDNKLTTEYAARLDEVLKLLYAEPSILRIAYRMPVDSEVSDARKRVTYVKDWIKEHWEPHDCCYDLQLEEEIVPATDSVEVIR